MEIHAKRKKGQQSHHQWTRDGIFGSILRRIYDCLMEERAQLPASLNEETKHVLCNRTGGNGDLGGLVLWQFPTELEIMRRQILIGSWKYNHGCRSFNP
mmetsp:Transcript_588/g.1053  ORF Transcript_588/g.1053 Transcript_588/m.1053 type:complete len:99 (-) Transcript_588:171-467(-)